MIAGVATLMPSDRFPYEVEERLLSTIKQHYFFFQTHMLTLLYTHSHICTNTDRETN